MIQRLQAAFDPLLLHQPLEIAKFASRQLEQRAVGTLRLGEYRSLHQRQKIWLAPFETPGENGAGLRRTQRMTQEARQTPEEARADNRLVSQLVSANLA